MKSEKDEFKIRIRGVRGSYPTPELDKLKYGGHTSCVEIVVGSHTIIFDAGTGIIVLGEDLYRKQIASGVSMTDREKITANIFITHSHIDHIMGLHYFKPAYVKTSNINFFGVGNYKQSFTELIRNSMFTPYFPLDYEELPSNLNIFDLEENNVVVFRENATKPSFYRYEDYEKIQQPNDVVISYYKSIAHPKDGVLIYRLFYKSKSVVFATDKEAYFDGDIKMITFSKNADILIHDAQYTQEEYNSPVNTKQGFGHSTPSMAVDTAIKANVGRLLLYHLDPRYSDEVVEKMEKEAQAMFANTQVAYEGMEIDLL